MPWLSESRTPANAAPRKMPFMEALLESSSTRAKCTLHWPYTPPCSTPTTANAAQGFRYSFTGVAAFICASLRKVWCGRMRIDSFARAAGAMGLLYTLQSWYAVAVGEKIEIPNE